MLYLFAAAFCALIAISLYIINSWKKECARLTDSMNYYRETGNEIMKSWTEHSLKLRADHEDELTKFRVTVDTLRKRGNIYRDALDEIIQRKGNHIHRSIAAKKVAEAARASTKGM